jgi:hypothetical protein
MSLQVRLSPDGGRVAVYLPALRRHDVDQVGAWVEVSAPAGILALAVLDPADLIGWTLLTIGQPL